MRNVRILTTVVSVLSGPVLRADIVSESFSITNGALPVEWSALSGTYAVSNQQAVLTSGSGFLVRTGFLLSNAADADGQSSMEVSADVLQTVSDSSVWSGIGFHIQDAQNGYIFRFSAGADVWQFLRMVNGTNYLVSSGNVTLSSNVFYRLTVRSSALHTFNFTLADTNGTALAEQTNVSETVSGYTGGLGGLNGNAPYLRADNLRLETRYVPFQDGVIPVVLDGTEQTDVLDTLVKDDFNRPDTDWQTAGSTNAIGADWLVTAQSWKISTNQVTMRKDNGVGSLVWQSAQTANTSNQAFIIEAVSKLTTGASSAYSGIVFNYQNTTNYYTLRYPGTGFAQMLRVRNGATTVLWSGAFSAVLGHPYRLMVASGAAQVFDWSIIDDATETTLAGGTVTDSGSGFCGGYGGLYANSSSSVFDDFRVQVNRSLADSKWIQGTPVLTQHGEIIAQDSFCANVYTNNTSMNEFQKTAERGLDVDFLRGLCVAVYTNTDKFVVNKTILDNGIQAVLADNPDARIILHVPCYPPVAWHSHFGNATKLKNETNGLSAYPDPNSVVYLNAVSNYMQDLVRYVESRPYSASVVGYQPALFDGSEWNMPDGYWGYSDATRSAFQLWLQNKYLTITNLCAAWQTNGISSFDSIAVPTVADFTAADWGAFRNPATRCKVTDFTEFWQDGNANCLLTLCQAIKDASTNAVPPLTGAFYGYILETVQAFYNGHHALRNVLDSPYIDFLAAPYSYVYRCSAWQGATNMDIGAGAYHGPVDSILSNGKLFFTEDDSRTYLTTDNSNSHFTNLVGTVANLRRNQLVNLCRGTGIWRLDLFGTGWYNSNELAAELGIQKQVFDSLQKDPNSQNGYRPDVALIVDETSSFDVATRSTTNSGPRICVSMFLRDHLCRTGINYGVYLLSDLIAGRVPDCSAYLFAGTYKLTRTDRNWIDENLKKDGKTLVWFYGSGLYDETGWGLDRMSTLTGLDIVESTNTVSSGIEPATALSVAVSSPGWNATSINGQPEWYPQNLSTNAVTLANYVHGSTRYPAIVMQSKGNWTTVYVGDLGLNPKWALGLMRLIGVYQYLDTDATVPCYAGHGIVGIWPTTNMTGTVHLKESSDIYNLYTGELLYTNVTGFSVNLNQWDVKGFKTCPSGSSWRPAVFSR